jgi:phage baseplate assembly protein W
MERVLSVISFDAVILPVTTTSPVRDYGSRLYQLVDGPINRALFVEVYAATAEALVKWEPRFQLSRVQVESVKPGQTSIALEGLYLPENRSLSLEGVLL